MKKFAVQAVIGLAAFTSLTHDASAAVASPVILVQNISSQFAGQPQYVGLQTFALFVLYQNPTDVMVNHGLADFFPVNGTFFNANPTPGGPDNPLSLIPATGGLTPINPAFFGIAGYAPWAWDSNLSSDNSPLSQADPGSSQTPTSVIGGAFTVPPPIGVAAGADLMVQLGQLTVTTGGIPQGHTTVLTVNPLGGNPIATVVTIMPPAPGSFVMLGLAALAGTRRRRP